MTCLGRLRVCTPLLALAVLLPSMFAQAQNSNLNRRNHIRRVLLVSIDGMHAVDYLNCSQGLASVNDGQPYCPNLAQLGQTAVNYLDTSTSRPSDSFPGLTTSAALHVIEFTFRGVFDSHLPPQPSFQVSQ